MIRPKNRDGHETERFGLRAVLAGVAAIVVLAPVWSLAQTRTPAKATNTGNLPRTRDGHPDLSGYWSDQAIVSTLNVEVGWDRTSPIVDPPDGKLPLQPWAAARRKVYGAINLNTDVSQIPAGEKATLAFVDPQTRCVPVGVPRINYATPYNGYQFLQTADHIVLFAEWNHTARVIPLDGRPHVGPKIRLWMGDARGRWEGDTLVVDVTNNNGGAWHDGAGAFSSDAMHVVERYTLTDADTIHYQVTVEDSKVLTRPWTLVFDFKRATSTKGHVAGAGKLGDADPGNPGFFQDLLGPGYELYEYACHEGNTTLDLVMGAIGLGSDRFGTGVTPPGPMTR